MTCSRLVDKRYRRRAVAKSLAEIQPEDTFETRPRDPETAPQVDIASAVAGGAAFNTHGIRKHRDTDMQQRADSPPLPSLSRDVRDCAPESLGSQHPVVNDRVRSQQRRTHSPGVARKPEICGRRDSWPRRLPS